MDEKRTIKQGREVFGQRKSIMGKKKNAILTETEDCSYIKAILYQLAMIDQTQSEQELQRVIQGVLQVIGENTGATRVVLFESSPAVVHSYSNTFEWCAKGVDSQLAAHQNVSLRARSMWMEAFVKGESVVIDDVENIRKLYPQEYNYMKERGLTSIILSPVFFKDRLSGFIGLENPKVTQPDLMTQLLALAGGHLGSTREHFRMLELLEKKQEYLRKSLEEKKKEKAVIGYRHIDDIVREEQQNQKNRETTLENERLNRENEAKTEFLSRMSHDIRTPMNAIMGLVDIARRNPNDPEKLRECIGKIGTAGKNLQQLVNDVLDITQIEGGEFKIKPDQMDLRYLLSYIRQIFDDMALKKGICFVYEEQGISRTVLMADELRLTQVYMNLLSNALKYTQEGGTVFFKVQEKEIPGTKKVELVSIIRDTGIGMEKEFMDVMYSKFSRAIDTRVNKVSGSGLGLSIVKKIVDLMDGKIEVRSVPEHGTTFKVTLRLPYCEEMQEKEEPKEISFDRTIRLLVAEDNDLNYEIEQELLAMHGIRTERACDGEVCVRKVKEAKEGTYDAILMDMQMPVMDGVMAAREIRSLTAPWAREIPIIAITANAFREDVQRCLEAGMDAHLAKPLELEKLLATLHKCLVKREV